MSIDKFFDAYVEKRGIVPRVEVVPENSCQIFQDGPVEGAGGVDGASGAGGVDGVDGAGEPVAGPPAEKSHSALERARELVARGLAE